MSSYDVHIGKLISERRELEGSGTYLICTPDKDILEVDSYAPEDGKFISSKDIEDALYEFCQSALDDYIADGSNKDVYTFSIYTDSYNGSYVIYINNQASLNDSVDSAYVRYQKQYLEKGYKHYNKTREQLYHEFKYGEGDYPFMYENMPARLEKWLGMINCLTQVEPDYLSIDQRFIFEKEIVDSQLFLIAIDVIHRLQDNLKLLDQTDDFIAYVSAADGVGGDYLTFSQLIRRCVHEDQLYKALPDLKEKDFAFQSAVQAVQQKPLHEQVEHWITVIERGEFGEGSMRSFLKTDYEAYEQLIELGTLAIPFIQEHVNGSLKPDTQNILEMVLQDLNT
ncbi:hypothetical protein ASG89_11240 [Paenibacillus sp. Soil766]|uniref:hypothetical protein n=1 Tax=Paenibacillus sp. Soil766 TaxID=1736404 RepID=UPI000709352B|nr:hypothetical protein [Paenibacillus sp. Soil766]KRE86570.1 hypothetical protein ASG89_11240 [Paenibacillus sp. Soil766]